ncbi:quinol:cytochrome C oxidoreductase [Vicingus serpentipes]|uniref:quinol:cytochrome C oxidoreductase n=1 Tax=Vicingus serpentipes TaxID=1926625 RepID=UPI001CB91E1C|nr:quinol:cytochrome C oxidoreductase [Vicingus serpentipes]
MEYKISKKANITTILLIVVGLAAFLIGLLTSHGHTGQRLWANLLVNGYFFFTISLASLFFLALQYVSEMAWGVTTHRIFQATMSFMPVSAIALLLVFIGGSLHWNHIYHWMAEGITDPTSHHYDAIIAGKSGYLNQAFFWGRTIAYFAVWMFFANWFRKNSLAEDKLSLADGETSPIYKKSIFMGVLFVAFFAYTSSSSAWDWLMSIDVHWFSTMFGWYAFSGMWVSSIIVGLMLVLYLKSQGYLKEVNDSHIHDLGKWMFGISCLWSYLWFSQFMLIWYSNIPEEVTYYLERFNDYKLLYLGTFFVNFILPFFVLMSRDAKRNVVFLVPVALIIFFTHWLDVLTMVLPGTMHDHGALGAIEIGMFLMFLGLFLMFTLRSLAKAPLMTKNHPMYDESVHLHT